MRKPREHSNASWLPPSGGSLDLALELGLGKLAVGGLTKKCLYGALPPVVVERACSDENIRKPRGACAAEPRQAPSRPGGTSTIGGLLRPSELRPEWTSRAPESSAFHIARSGRDLPADRGSTCRITASALRRR